MQAKTTWEKLGLPESLQQALKDMKFERPSKIQNIAIRVLKES